MIWYYKLGIYLIIILVLVGGGYYSGHKSTNQASCPAGEVKTIVVDKEGETKTLTVFKDRIVTVTKIVKPDGTTEEHTSTEEKEQEQHIDQTIKEHVVSVDIKPNLTRYSLGLYFPLKFSRFVPTRPSVKDVDLMFGVRTISNLWLDGGYNFKDKSVLIGLRYDF